MTTDLTTRRQIRKLTRADFEAYPVWEWAINEEGLDWLDESYVRPTVHSRIPTGECSHFVVAATATLRDGTTLPACVEVGIKGKARRFFPMAILMPDRHLDFQGMETTRVLSHYTKRESNEPVRWQLAVPLEDERKLRSGKLRGSIAWWFIEMWNASLPGTRHRI